MENLQSVLAAWISEMWMAIAVGVILAFAVIGMSITMIAVLISLGVQH